MRIKKRKKYIFIIIVCMMYLYGMASFFVHVNSVDKQSLSNTNEFSDVITGIDIEKTGRKVHLEIHTKEYNATLNVSDVICEKLDIADICNTLKEGDTIFFRVENRALQLFEQLSFADLVALKTLDKEIFSLDDYNSFMHKEVLMSKAKTIFLAQVLLLIGGCCFFRLKWNGVKYSADNTHKNGE